MLSVPSGQCLPSLLLVVDIAVGPPLEPILPCKSDRDKVEVALCRSARYLLSRLQNFLLLAKKQALDQHD